MRTASLMISLGKQPDLADRLRVVAEKEYTAASGLAVKAILVLVEELEEKHGVRRGRE